MGYPYAARVDLRFTEERLIELTDSTATPGVVDESAVTAALVDGAVIIDGKLFGKYVTPVVGPPSSGVLRLFNADVSRYLLYRRRETLQMPETVKTDYDRALRELDRIVDGDGDLLGAPRVGAETGPTPGGGGIEDVKRRFGRSRDGL